MKLMQLCVGMVRTNCYIVYDEATREAAVIDPGDNAKSILHAVNEEQLNVKYVLLTHAHFDHILAAHEVLEATGAQYVVPEKDTWLLSRDNMGQFRGLARNYVQDTPDILANEGTEVTFGGMTATYMATPGHTPGSHSAAPLISAMRRGTLSSVRKFCPSDLENGIRDGPEPLGLSQYHINSFVFPF